MLVDGRIRSRVVLMADAVQDDVQAALADTLREASTRRRRVVVTRVAMVALLVVATAGVWLGSDWSFTEQRERHQPADGMKHWNPPDHLPEERTENEDHDGLSGGGGILGSIKVPEGDVPPSGSVDARSNRAYPGRGGYEVRDDPLQEPSYERYSRRESAEYQMPVVRPRVDPRQSCSVLGEGCVRFETRPEDRFMRVTVVDDSGGPVLVRITQWDRHGNTVADTTIYCGGASQKLEIIPTAISVGVEIDDGDCGSETQPSGGRVDFVSFHG